MPGPPAYTFGPFRLEPAERRLLGGAGPVSLAPKALDLLILLVENSGRLLRKEELMDRLWPGVFVEEVNLAQNISAIRRALGGHGKKAFVETVAGAGYRFTAPVTKTDEDASHPPRAEPTSRLIVLPFRVLTPDAAIDFLSFGLPDALTASLSGVDALLVRSSLTAAKYASETPDLDRLSREADVNLVLSGTIVRAGESLRVTVQLTDVDTRALAWSHAETGRVTDLFALQDALVERILTSLATPLSSGERLRLRHDVPRTPRAYEYYLRANEASIDANTWPVARDLYLEAIEEDAGYAPAWARLARVYRLLGKYRPESRERSLARSEDALQRALALNPDLSFAHTIYAQLECDKGEAEAAMVRLLNRARPHRRDAEVYAGLVHACRYCGLTDASIAADRLAHELDPSVATSVMHSFYVRRDYERVLGAHGVIRGYVYVMSLFALGRTDEALQVIAAQANERSRVQELLGAARALIEGRHADSAAIFDNVSKSYTDPEAWYYAARHYAYLGLAAPALRALRQAVEGGYFCYSALSADPWFDAVRAEADYEPLAQRARTGEESARAAFATAGGPEILR